MILTYHIVPAPKKYLSGRYLVQVRALPLQARCLRDERSTVINQRAAAEDIVAAATAEGEELPEHAGRKGKC